MLTGHPHGHLPSCPISQGRSQLLQHLNQRRDIKAAAKSQTAKARISSVPIPDTAKEAVETGLQLFEQGQTEDALRLFSAVSGLQPKQEEIRAAEYNKACALVKLKDWQQAAEAVVQAVNEHGEDLKTALQVQAEANTTTALQPTRCGCVPCPGTHKHSVPASQPK